MSWPLSQMLSRVLASLYLVSGSSPRLPLCQGSPNGSVLQQLLDGSWATWPSSPKSCLMLSRSALPSTENCLLPTLLSTLPFPARR